MVVTGYWEVTKSNQDAISRGRGCGRSPQNNEKQSHKADFCFIHIMCTARASKAIPAIMLTKVKVIPFASS